MEANEDKEARLTTVRYKRWDFPNPKGQKQENTLLAFVYDVPYLDACGIFPPLHILNSILQSGGGEGGMSPGATWTPFTITSEEYTDLVEAIKFVPIEYVKSRARYAWLRFTFDPSFDHIEERFEWLRAVCDKHRELHHSEMKSAGLMAG